MRKSRMKRIGEHTWIFPLESEKDRPNLGYIRGDVFGGTSFLKTDGDVSCAKRLSETGRIVYCADAGIGIRGVESLIEKDDAVVAIEHQIAGMDCAGLVCGCGKR